MAVENTAVGAEQVKDFTLAQSSHKLHQNLAKGKVDKKLQREMQFGKGVTYHFGIHDGRELESWHEGIEFWMSGLTR